MNAGGTTQAITASPPLDLVIGNATDVTLTWKGQRVDLAPHTRQNVARLRLQ
jgi:cytoskeleton protein RodZ